MKRFALAAVMALIAASSAAWAEEDEGPYSKGSQAKNWNLLGQEKALFEAKVVDILCELTGDCPDNCGDGRRQLGLLRADDGKLLLANKNIQPAFTGANLDLLPYCNQEVEVDGLLVGLEDYTPAKMYQVQLIRKKGESEWSKTARWTKEWNKANPELAEVKAPWFRKDPRIKALIERDGYLGLGLEKDEEFKKYFFEE